MPLTNPQLTPLTVNPNPLARANCVLGIFASEKEKY